MSDKFVGRAMYDLARSLFMSLKKWARSGFRVVDYSTYWQRKRICKICSLYSTRCPQCGCFLFAICRMSTTSCPNWDKHVKSDPSKFEKFAVVYLPEGESV